MYKMIVAFLCGFFTYGLATRFVPAHAAHPLPAAGLSQPSAQAGRQSPVGTAGESAGTRMLPVYVPTQDAAGVRAWAI